MVVDAPSSNFGPCPFCRENADVVDGFVCSLCRSIIPVAQGGRLKFREITRSSHATALQEVVHALVNSRAIPRSAGKPILEAMLRREALGSTAIGRGLAIPHAKSTHVDKLLGAVVRHRQGVQFDSLDGQPVRFLVMIISPPDRPGKHLEFLEHVSELLRGLDFDDGSE